MTETLASAGGRSRRPRSRGRSGRQAPSPAVVQLVKWLVLAVCCAVVVVPFISVISTSLAGANQVTKQGGYVLWPAHPTFASFQAILTGGVVPRALAISVGVTVVGTLLSLTCTTLLAYSLSRPVSFGHRKLLMIVILTLFFTPGIIPSFLLVKELGLLNSYWSLILPVLVNGFNVVVMRAFFLEMPSELIDSARIDGAGDLKTLIYVVLPLSKAVMSVIGLFYAVAYWNAFFNALLYINDQSKWPLQLVLRTYVLNGLGLGTTGSTSQLTNGAFTPPPQQSLDAAILVLALIPILILYPFLQRHFIKGVLVGAIKG